MLDFQSLLRKIRRHGRNFRKPLIAVGVIALVLWGLSINQYIGEAYVKLIYDPNQPKPLTYLIDTPGCRIINMDPFDSDGHVYLNRSRKMKKCPLPVILLDGDMLVYNKSHKFYTDTTSCCYANIIRKTQSGQNYTEEADRLISYSRPCVEIPKSGLKMPSEHVRVTCNYDPTTKVKPEKYYYAKINDLKTHSKETAEKEAYWQTEGAKEKTEIPPPSIVIVGIGSCSRNNFLRTMTETRKYLLEQDFVELKGFSKLGDRPFYNVLSLLTGKLVNEDEDKTVDQCYTTRTKLDDCPLIFKKFSALNYVTALVEDAPGLGTLRIPGVGFVKQPTDYYYRPFSVAYDEFGHLVDAKASCVGGYPETQLVLNYSTDFVRIARHVPYFLYQWHSTANYKDMSALKAWDKSFKLFFQETLEDTKGQDHEPVIIVLGDEGQKYGYFRTTFAGYYEDALPVAYIHIPAHIKRTRPDWYTNLKINALRISTSFDMYAALEDLIQLITPSEGQVPSSLTSGARPNDLLYAKSLFSKIPAERTCRSAMIEDRNCRCGVEPHEREETELAEDMIEFVMDHMNSVIEPAVEQGLCMYLTASDLAYLMITREQDVYKYGQKFSAQDIVVGIELENLDAIYDAQFRYYPENLTATMIGPPTARISHLSTNACTQDPKIKPYCFCTDYYEKVVKNKNESSP